MAKARGTKANKPAKAKAKKTRQTVDIDKLVPTTSPDFQEKHKAYQKLAGNKDLANKQWYAWYRQQPKSKTKNEVVDDNIELIKEALIEIKKKNPKFDIKRPGYLITKGRAKKKGDPTPIIVKPAK
jgi:hypothetical protein